MSSTSQIKMKYVLYCELKKTYLNKDLPERTIEALFSPSPTITTGTKGFKP